MTHIGAMTLCFFINQFLSDINLYLPLKRVFRCKHTQVLYVSFFMSICQFIFALSSVYWRLLEWPHNDIFYLLLLIKM